MEVTGKIKVINAEQQVSASFKKRELVVATEEQYPQFISINFVQDKCDLLNNYNVGDAVKVSINLRGREWTSPQGEVKYFNTMEAWRIEGSQTASAANPAPAASTTNANPAPAPAAQPQETIVSSTGDDDLPF